MRRVAVASITTILLLSACVRYSSPTLEEAEQLSREGRYDEAISGYRRHMEERLALENRPEWENPYFYLLLIGDIELGRNDVAASLRSYEEAERHGVHQTLISDRYRSVARYHEERGELEAARKVLETYRTRDPLLFESMLDRIARKLTESEDTPK
jgi:hypothetical protein